MRATCSALIGWSLGKEPERLAALLFDWLAEHDDTIERSRRASGHSR
jgi:hypothetical protein